MKTVTITGRAEVTFKKVIHGMCQEEIDEIKDDHELLGFQIDITDVEEIVNVEYISIEYQP